MSNWITGNELMGYWDIEDFELFGCLKKGLQPYTKSGHKIIDTDRLEHARDQPLEWHIARTRRANMPNLVEEGGRARVNSGHFIPMSEREILEEARKQWESQPLRPVNPPPHHMSFALPLDEKIAWAAISTVMNFIFRKDEASEYAQKHRYQIFNEQGDGNTREQPQTDSNFSGVKYEPWLYGEKVKNILNTDNAGLVHLIKERVLVPHYDNLEPFTEEDFKFMMSDPGYWSPAWPEAGLDGFMFRKDEVLRFSESQGISMGVDKDEDVHQIASNRADSEVNEKASIPEEEGPHEKLIAPSKILLQLEPEDHVKIQIPGKDAEIISIIKLGFRSAATGAAKAFKEILENGQYLSVDDKSRDHIKQAEMKLQEHFKTKEKFIVLSEKRSGRYVPVFKIKAQIQKEALERDLERLKELGDIDQVRDEITAAYEKKIIDGEAAKCYYEKYRGVSAQSIYDESDLAKNPSDKGSSHLL
jgi:hypothetical protein